VLQKPDRDHGGFPIYLSVNFNLFIAVS